MERLTEKAFKPSVNSQYVKKKGFYTADCIERLGVYEDTGLTPPEIVELKERDTAKEIQKVDEQPYFRKRFHSYICPVCHKKVEFGWLFCGHCGQKLKRKD